MLRSAVRNECNDVVGETGEIERSADVNMAKFHQDEVINTCTIIAKDLGKMVMNLSLANW